MQKTFFDSTLVKLFNNKYKENQSDIFSPHNLIEMYLPWVHAIESVCAGGLFGQKQQLNPNECLWTLLSP